MHNLSPIEEELSHLERQRAEFLHAMYRKLWLCNKKLRDLAFSPAAIFREARRETILVESWDAVGLPSWAKP